jgi:hypothetical protein
MAANANPNKISIEYLFKVTRVNIFLDLLRWYLS